MALASKEEDAAEPISSKKQQASISDFFSFVFDLDVGTKLIGLVGTFAAIGNGFVQPVVVLYFARLLSELAGAQTGLADIRRLAFTLMVIGVYALVVGTLQTACFEIVGHRAALSFRMQWFTALLRQDSAFFDVHNVSGLASTFQSDCNKFQRGLGRKLGAGIENMTLFFVGIGFAFYVAWQIALIFMCGVPFAVFFTLGTVRTNKDKGTRASVAYSKAGSIACTTVSSVRTVFSLNAIPEMISQYKDATLEAFELSILPLWKQGFYFGGLFATFMCLFCVVTLLGTVLLQNDVRQTGCDPSESGISDILCSPGGPAIYQAMLYFTFAAVGISQFGNFLESFTPARIAAYPAIQTIRRQAGAPEERIYEDDQLLLDQDEDEADGTKLAAKNKSDGRRLKAIIPEYRIDASSLDGLKPSKVDGLIEFKNVHFKYPTRPRTKVLDGLDLVIEAGKTTALVGASGGGKSTTVALIERFYDPLEGTVSLDGIDVKDINVHHLRSLLGYVGQEPALFATTIAGNIRYGKSTATQEEVEAAAKSANAHDFIMSFPDGYDTQVGDKGAQLSGGQKQRIAIARVLVSEPAVLLLDEATSALDSESELVVQDALDNLVAERKRTTVVIAHRLSTVRNADKIAVINGGKVVEQGTHEELIARNGPYCALVNKQELRSSSTSSTDLAKLGEEPSLNASSALDGQASQFEFKNINFAYPSRPKRKIFDDFSLNIKTGETLALVGPSGGGKSTVVALIERFYDPMQGSVNYKGCDIRSLNLQWYRDQIGYVGQEPTLFNTTIAKNIAYGAPSATQEEIEEAARQANIHSTILSFPDGYKTEVGERGTQLSGGQKQRIAIARALVKKPSVLLLDEATSALDTDSEALVQEALDKLMASKERTTIVIAHRLSTIQSSDRIAFIAKGTVLECASHDDLMKLNGRYRRLVDSQNRSNEISANMLRMSTKSNADDDEEEDADVSSVADEAEEQASTGQIARRMAIPDTKYMVLGGIGAVFAGAVFPAWGYMYASMIELLFTVVPECTEGDFPDKSCDEYYDDVAKDMSQKSYELGVYWAVVALSCLFGNMVTFWGFGMSSERLNKRIRDSAYSSLVRQEVGYFDVRSVGNITSLLEDDAARIQTFSGEPIRTMLIALSSLIIGLVLAFVFMWPVALVAVACVPFVGAASSIDAAKTQGKDNEEDEVKDQDELYSPGGIIVETLLNIRTVAALTLEEKRSKDLEEALRKSRKDYVVAGFIAGLTSGLAVMIQNWSNALQLWFGGWVLFNYPDVYTFRDFLICYLGILFSMVGLGSAVSGLSDMKQAEESAKRVFQLLDRHTKIDPLSEEGKKLD